MKRNFGVHIKNLHVPTILKSVVLIFFNFDFKIVIKSFNNKEAQEI